MLVLVRETTLGRAYSPQEIPQFQNEPVSEARLKALGWAPRCGQPSAGDSVLLMSF